MKALTKNEIKALAMHELMKREQELYSLRATEQRKINMMSTEKLQQLAGVTTATSPEVAGSTESQENAS